MKLLNRTDYITYSEIEVEHTFLCFFKYKAKYRLYQPSGTILKFKEPNKYYSIGAFEYFNIVQYFHIVEIEKNEL